MSQDSTQMGLPASGKDGVGASNIPHPVKSNTTNNDMSKKESPLNSKQTALPASGKDGVEASNASHPVKTNTINNTSKKVSPPNHNIITQSPKQIDLPWGGKDGVTTLKDCPPSDSGMSLQRSMKEAKPIALVLKIPSLSGLTPNYTALTDGKDILLGSSDSDGSAELAILDLRSFTCRRLDNKELRDACWPIEAIKPASILPAICTSGVQHAAIHSGLVILLMKEKDTPPSFKSFSTSPKLKPTPSPILPEGFFLATAVSLDERYICLAGHVRNSEHQWTILIWDRTTLEQLATLSIPRLEYPYNDEWIEDICIRKNCIAAVAVMGHLYYWDTNFAVIQDRSSLTDYLCHEETEVDTVWVSRDQERMVMMCARQGEYAAMTVGDKASLISAYVDLPFPNGPYPRIDVDCQTVARPAPNYSPNFAPQYDIYPISEGEPHFRIHPISDWSAAEIGGFLDVWVNSYSLTYFGTEGVLQIRFVGQNTIPDEAYTSSRYLTL